MPEKKRDHSGALIGGGATAATVGAVGGGIPGVKARKLLVDVKNEKKKTRQAKTFGQAYRGGEFGYRHNAHNTFSAFGMPDPMKHEGKARSFMQGDVAGRRGAEKKIIRHLAVGRKASNVLLAGGTAAAGVGTYKHLKNKKKAQVSKAKGDTRRDVAIGAGGTTAGLGYGLSGVLRREGKKWAAEGERGYKQAANLNPSAGAHTTKLSRKSGVKTSRGLEKTETTAARAGEHFAGKSKMHAREVGRLRGAADQASYFGHTYGKFSKITRKVGHGGALVTAAGLGAAYNQSRKPVKKSVINYKAVKAVPMKKGRGIPGTSARLDEKGRPYFPYKQPVKKSHSPFLEMPV